MEPKLATNLPLLGLLVLCLVQHGGAAAGTQKHSNCNGSIAEGEFLMESDIGRMILQVKTHITYGALKKDKPVCGSSGRGQSYSSCYPDPSNPYSRGCSRIYRCRGDS